MNPLSDDAQDQIDRLLFNLSSFLNGQRHAVSKEPLTMGVAISMGRVLAGNIGATQRMEYTVIGEPVNLAVRLVDGGLP